MRHPFVKKGDIVTSPNTLVIPRDDRAYDPSHQPQVSERMTPYMEMETAPQPVQYSAFHSIGRMTSRRWFHQVLAYPDKLSIRAWEGAGSALVNRTPGALVVNMPMSTGQNPARDRVDVVQPRQTTYGSLSVLNPDPTYSRAYAKLY